MRVSHATINVFGLVFWTAAIYAAVSGHVSWWVVALLALNSIELNVTLRKGDE